MEADSDCEAQITSVCSDVKEEEQFIPIIKHEDEVGLHIWFSFVKVTLFTPVRF